MTEEDEEFERIEREQARAIALRKFQIEEQKQKRERCPTCDRAWSKDEAND
jgi:hypothetical protein